MQYSSIIIADLQSHSVGGHFATWLNRTIQEAAEYFENVSVYVADKFSYPASDIIDKLGEKLAIFEIEPIRVSRKWHGDVLGVIQEHHAHNALGARATPIFIMWAQQYLDRNILYPPLQKRFLWNRKRIFSGNWGTLFSAGSLAYKGSEKHDVEEKAHKTTLQDPSCKGVFLWDSYAVSTLKGKYIYLPDVEEVSADIEWNRPKAHPIVIGSVGQLWGYRSVNFIVEILSENYDIKAYLGGVLKQESYNESAANLINNGSSRINIEDGFVKTDHELNNRIKNLDAFVIDSRTYKYPSGLAIRAMAMGRPIITLDYPSWASNLVREHGVGVIYESGRGNLNEQLRSWYGGGGSNKSRTLASKLNDLSGMKDAYKKMFERLSCNK